MRSKKQVLILIESDILNSKLVFTLNNIGVDASDYLIDIPDVVFKLMGIKKEKQTEELFKKYYALVRKVEHLELKTKDEKERLSKEIYTDLLTEV